jgi:hypothetical protein
VTPEKVMRGSFRNPGGIRAFLCKEIFIGDASDSVSSKEKNETRLLFPQSRVSSLFYANIATRKDLL